MDRPRRERWNSPSSATAQHEIKAKMLDLTDPLELFAEGSLIPTRFLLGATGLGKHLDPGSEERNLPAGANTDVPLWLVKPLLRRGMVNVKPPAIYGERYRRKLNAGAECVSLKNTAPYFYDVGNKLNEFLKDVELSAFLTRTFKTRYHELIYKGLNTMTGEEVLQLSSKLTVEEQQLFESGRLSIQHVDEWLRGVAPACASQKTNAQTMRVRKRQAEEAAAGQAPARHRS